MRALDEVDGVVLEEAGIEEREGCGRSLGELVFTPDLYPFLLHSCKCTVR